MANKENKKIKPLVIEDKANARFTRADRKPLLILVLVYAVIALFNLGTLNFPATTWTAQPGDTAVLDFGGAVDIGGYWVNANISEAGELTMTSDNGQAITFAQKNGEMFKWNTYSERISARQLTLTVASGKITINEIAFFDGQGNQLPVQVVSDSGAQLVDEQRTVPLSTAALDILRGLPRPETQDAGQERVFRMIAAKITDTMLDTCRKAGLENLRFHDLRHEATSRFFEHTDLDLMEIRAITGHKTLQMLIRYTHLRTARLADRLAGGKRGK